MSSGYWIVVQEFTHKSTVKEIERLVRVVTDLGRSTFHLTFTENVTHVLNKFCQNPAWNMHHSTLE